MNRERIVWQAELYNKPDGTISRSSVASMCIFVIKYESHFHTNQTCALQISYMHGFEIIIASVQLTIELLFFTYNILFNNLCRINCRLDRLFKS